MTTAVLLREASTVAPHLARRLRSVWRAEPAEVAYRKWFDNWAPRYAEAAGLEHPGLPPFVLGPPPFDKGDFDGCSYVPDFCIHACLAHDVACHFARTAAQRAAADAALYRAVVDMGRFDGRAGKAWWRFKASYIWLGVRLGALKGIGVRSSIPVALALACVPQAQLMDELASRYRETPVVDGVTSDGALLRITASPDGGTWTALLLRAGSPLACIIGAGRGFVVQPPPPPGEPS